MDQKFINNVFVAYDCNRTANVQVTDPSTTATYIGKGEMVVKGLDGTCYTAASNVTDKEEILRIVTRNKTDNNEGEAYIVESQEIYGGYIKSASIVQYKAPVQQAVAVSALDETLAASAKFTYTIRVRDVMPKERKHGDFKSYEYEAAAGSTRAQIVAGLVSAINAQSSLAFPVVASADGGSSDVLVIQGTVLPYKEGKFPYEQFRFVVEVGPYIKQYPSATISDNLGAALAIAGGTTFSACTIGDGHYKNVKDLEWFSANNFQGHKAGRQLNRPYEAEPLNLNVTSGETYDKVVIHLEPQRGTLSVSSLNPSTITLCLSIGIANQSDDVIAVLNAYFTLWGIDTITLS